jgi:hypothetical protein
VDEVFLDLLFALVQRLGEFPHPTGIFLQIPDQLPTNGILALVLIHLFDLLWKMRCNGLSPYPLQGGDKIQYTFPRACSRIKSSFSTGIQGEMQS